VIQQLQRILSLGPVQDGESRAFRQVTVSGSRSTTDHPSSTHVIADVAGYYLSY
jgi:hypothetical protein